MSYIIHGATGAQGSPVLSALTAASAPAVAAVRNPDTVPDGVQALAVDLSSAASLIPAYEGAEGVFVHLPMGPPEAAGAQARAVVEAVEQARPDRVVISASGQIVDQPDSPLQAPDDSPIMTLIHGVMRSGIPTAVVAPRLYLENLLLPVIIGPAREEGVLRYPLPASFPVSWSSHLDVADVVVRLLTDARPIGVSGDRDSVISINGHNITVARPEFEDQNFGTTSDDGKTRTITNGRNIMSYVRFGFHTEFGGAGNDKQHYVFALGDPTPTDKMPTSGDTYYIGLSTFAMGTNPEFRTGLSSFHVNFDEKTIDGEVYGDSRVNPIGLGGKINGNAFSGSKDGVEMQGHFYGPQAEQVGGIFKGTATDIPGIDEPTPVMGSFGARRL